MRMLWPRAKVVPLVVDKWALTIFVWLHVFARFYHALWGKSTLFRFFDNNSMQPNPGL